MNALIDVVQEYQYFGWLALLATVFLTPVAIRAAHRYRVLDMPDQVLKPHARPIPYLGGTAICAAWSAALLVAMLTGVCDWQMTLPLLLGGVVMSLLGLADDVYDVPPKTRLLVGTIAITGAILLSGAGLRLAEAATVGISSVLGTEILLPAAISVPASVVAGVFIVLGACNSTNLIDGLDGLATGVTAIISFGFFLLAAHLAVWDYSQTHDPVRLVLAVAMLGAAIGFLPWNFNPARIFMGDAGSMLLGYNCGMLILLFAERGTLRWVVGALMIFALPVFDTALAMFRRWRAGRSIFEGDRSHFYDQLVQRGLSVRQTVAVCYMLTVFYAAVGLLLTWVGDDGAVLRLRFGVLVFVVICVLTGVVAWRVGLTNPEAAAKRSETDVGD